MRLHRLRLVNYRGVVDQVVDFADSGVTVVEGPNEVGKSSMIEALDLLFETPDSSNKKNVKDIKPAGKDVGSLVEAEISCGPYHFVYRKQFNKATVTELIISKPKPEQQAGRAAHDRAKQIFDDNVDVGLWKALRLMQARGADNADLISSDSLSRALDAAAGEVVNSDASGVLLKRIDEEYFKYYTATGKSSKVLADVERRLAEAREAYRQCEQQLAEVDRDIARHETLQNDLFSRKKIYDNVFHQLQELNEQGELVKNLRAKYELASSRVQTAMLEEQKIRSQAKDREDLHRSIFEISERLKTQKDELELANERLASASAELVEQEAAVSVLKEERSRVALECKQARADAELLKHQDNFEKLSDLLSLLAQERKRVSDLQNELAKIVVTPELLAKLDEAAAAVDIARAQYETASTQVQLTSLTDQKMWVNEEEITTRAGDVLSHFVTEQMAVQFPGVLSLSIVPGQGAGELTRVLDVAQQNFSDLLAEAQVVTLSQARDAVSDKQLIERDMHAAQSVLDRLLAGKDSDDIREEQLAVEKQIAQAIASRNSTDPIPKTLLEAALLVEERERKLESISASVEELISAVSVAQQLNTNLRIEVSQITSRVQSNEQELLRLTARLERTVQEISDTDISDLLLKYECALAQAQEDSDAVQSHLAEINSEVIEEEIANLNEAVHDGHALITEITEELRELSARLTVIGSQGRKSNFDSTATILEHTEREYHRTLERAVAAKTLREVMLQHREVTRNRYVEPFKKHVESLGRIVFGSKFLVAVDSNLRITHRTIGEVTVDFDALSGGAKEQLGIISRLACAIIVSAEGGVPVLIDDALGYTDPVRLSKMGAVLKAAARDSQVIVLTCVPDRYHGVGGAHTVRLS
ncbi:MAG: AAA family ATPase [Mycobacteriaceae bacterium]